MKWLLVVAVFGNQIVSTDLMFDSLNDCLTAEEQMRKTYADAINKWLEWAPTNPTASGFPNSRDWALRKFGVKNEGTCIPHAAQLGALPPEGSNREPGQAFPAK